MQAEVCDSRIVLSMFGRSRPLIKIDSPVRALAIGQFAHCRFRYSELAHFAHLIWPTLYIKEGPNLSAVSTGGRWTGDGKWNYSRRYVGSIGLEQERSREWRRS